MGLDTTNFDPNQHSDGGSGDLLPTGEYVMMVKGFKRNVRKGKNQIDFTLRAVLNHDRKRVSSDYSPVWETVTIQANAIWRLANLCEAIGHMTPFNLDDDRELAGAVKGKPFKVRVIHETYNGKKSARLKNYMKLNDGDIKAFEEAVEDMAMDDSTEGYSGDDMSGGSSNDFTDDDLPF